MATNWRPLEEGAIAIAHVSDPHFGSDNASKVWLHVDGFLTGTLKPELVLVSGDLVHSPDEKHYDEALRALRALKLDFFVCAGNHDRHVLGNRVERNLITSVAGNPLVQEKARLFLNTTVHWLAVVIGLLVGLGSVVIAAMFVGLAFGSVIIGVILGLLAYIGTDKLAPSWIKRFLIRRIDAQINQFSAGHTSTLFEGKFAEYVLPHKTARPIPLGRSAEKWEIGLLALESSSSADCFARGKIETGQLIPLTTATQGKQEGGARAEFDLCILLVHHHLLPVRALEPERDGNASDLLNATCLVNTGTLLEKLAEARVDMVLHGHEHKHNWGTYESLEEGFGPVRVVAAGSATGNDSFKGCLETQASFNVIILAPDRSVRLRRMILEGGSWKQDAETDVTLFTPEEVRQSRVRRRALIDTGDTRMEYKSEMVKYIQFTRVRDIQLYWLWTNWILKQAQFTHKVTNSTGVPVDPAVVLSGSEGSINIDAKFEPRTGEDHVWDLCFTVPPEFLHKRIRVSVQYSWQGGGLLTSEDLEALNHDDRLGKFRNQGFEFWSNWTNGQTIAVLEVHLSLPPEYAPPTSNKAAAVQVRVHEADMLFEAEAAALQKQLRSLAKGRYSLRIPYPRVNRRYTLLWKPVSQTTAAKRLESHEYTSRFASLPDEEATGLLKKFAVPLQTTPFWGRANLGLYVKSVDPSLAVRKAHIPLADDPAFLPAPPETIHLDHERNLLVQGFWGIAVKEERPDDPHLAKDFGFQPDEVALVAVPIRFVLSGATNPPPWGVLRIGVRKTDQVKLPVAMDDVTITKVLSGASMRLLAQFFSKES